MASTSGNSSGSGQLQNSGSEEDLQHVMDQRKRKRMQSNRESARRSRMRKQKHLDDLMAQVAQLKKDNSEILTRITITTKHLMTIETENSILRAQLMELDQRLESLNEIRNYINTTSNGIGILDTDQAALNTTVAAENSFMNMNPINLIYLNQPIMASADIFQF